MIRVLVLLRAIGIGMLLVACDPQARGFALPPGDIQRGQNTFVELRCNSCHSVKGSVERVRDDGHSQIYVQLGGEVTRVKTYGDLVTSIITPSPKLARGPDPRHVGPDGESKMQRYNEVMTVQQLIDLTAFLSSTYSVWTPEYATSPH